MGFHIVLHEPEQPGNTGAIGRTCICAGASLYLIRPLGFFTDERSVRRAGLDYWPRLGVREYDDYDAFLAENPGARIWYLTTKARRTVAEADFRDGDYLMFGKESAGIPEEILAAHPDRCVRIPMVPGERSLNLSNAVAAALFEALRHTDYAGLEKYGELRRETWAELPKTDGSKDNDRRDGMSIYSQRAQAFRDRTDVHRNCAQAVLMTFAPELGLTEETAAKLCRHFGSGMKIGAACGAYTGGLMVLGLAGLGETEAAEEFTRAFEELEDGRLDCRDLLRVNTDRGGEKKPFCDHLIRACVLQLEEMLRHKGVIA